jgi:hypothetical protein
MPAVNDVGEPCAGEPHARFDGRGLETERKRYVTAPAPDPTVELAWVAGRHSGCAFWPGRMWPIKDPGPRHGRHLPSDKADALAGWATVLR